MLQDRLQRGIRLGTLAVPLELGPQLLVAAWRGDDRPGAPTLVIDWAESGGPPVSPPEREGFGSRLIRRGLGDRGGKVELDYRPEGLRCRIEATL